MGMKGWETYVPPTRADLKARAENQAVDAVNKYGAKKTQSRAGYMHDSKKEAARFDVLVLCQKSGAIRDLMPHPSFPLFVNGQRTGRITFDSLHVENGQLICEDVKSPSTAKSTSYRQRIKTFNACYPHIITREFI
jgi:hypothetical protein